MAGERNEIEAEYIERRARDIVAMLPESPDRRRRVLERVNELAGAQPLSSMRPKLALVASLLLSVPAIASIDDWAGWRWLAWALS
jgi:hypothetical protein